MKGEYENVATDEKPPVYDHTQAIIVQDEKRAAAAPNLLELLGGCKLNSLNDSIELELQYRNIVTACLTLSYFFQNIVAFLSLFLGISGVMLVLMGVIVHIACFIELRSEEHSSHKFFLVTYTVQFLLSTILAGYGMFFMWSPSFCRELPPYFSYQQCQNNRGLLQVVESTVLIANVFLEARVLFLFQKVYKHAEMNENVKKQTNSVMLV